MQPHIFGIKSLPLTADDLAALGNSYINPDVAVRAGVFRVDNENGAALVGQSARNGRQFSGLVFPYLSPDGKILECRLRRDFPDLQLNEKGEERERGKYMGPRERPPKLYRSAPQTRELLASGAKVKRYVFVEGEKKALALDRFFAERGEAVAVLGLAGVDSFSCNAEKRDHTTKPKKVWVKGMLPELTAIEWKDTDVWILFDANVQSNLNVKGARRKLTNLLTTRGASVLHVEIPEGIPGVNGIDDLLAIKGPAFVADLFEQQMKKPALTAVRFYASAQQDMKPLTAKVWEVLEDSEKLFGRSILWSGGILSRLQPQVDRVKIEELTLDFLCYRLIDLAKWWNVDKRSGVEYLTTPPPKLVSNLIAAPMIETPIPSLNRVVTAPVFTADGSLLIAPGYDEASGIYYLETFEVLPPPQQVTPEEVEAAVKYLDENLFADFPFAGAADRAHAFALLILPFVREMINGPTPLHLIEAAVRGAGKGLLTKACLIPSLGQGGICETPQPEDDAEMRKAITSALMENKGALIIDNANRKLDSGALAAALTSNIWSDRVLGSNKTASTEVRLTFILTANNLEISSEMVRRSIPIRLAPDTDAPEDRTGFKHDILLEWIAENRAEIVKAVHTIALNWIANGKPDANITLGSYENWARVMGGILRTAGIPGFLQNRKELRERSDVERGARAAFCDEWWEKRRAEERAIEAAGSSTPSRLRRAISSELYPIAKEIEGLPLDTYSEQGAIKSFGKYLSASEGVCPEHIEKDSDGRVIYSRRFRIIRAGTRKRAILWELELLDGPADDPAHG
jgi:hypothetical protein